MILPIFSQTNLVIFSEISSFFQRMTQNTREDSTTNSTSYWSINSFGDSSRDAQRNFSIIATENVSALHGNCFHRHYFENVFGNDLFQFVLHEFLKSSIMFLHSQNIIVIALLDFPNISTQISPGIPFVF